MKYYLTITKNKILIYSTWMNLKHFAIKANTKVYALDESFPYEILDKANYKDRKQYISDGLLLVWGRENNCKGPRGSLLRGTFPIS